MFSLPEYLRNLSDGGLAGNLLVLSVWTTLRSCIGASGAIFALFGACVIY